MYSTVTFEGNLAADVEVKENKAGGIYVDAVVLVNHGKDSEGSEGSDRTPTRWQTRITGRTAENAANLRKADRLLVTGSVVTDSWTDKATGDTRYATRVLAQSVGVSLTFARVTDIQRNAREQA
jgi:single-strand DNA-binding protein